MTVLPYVIEVSLLGIDSYCSHMNAQSIPSILMNIKLCIVVSLN